MSSETIPARGERQLSDADWINIINRVLSGDLLPRNSSGIVTDLAGQLGTDSLEWLKVRISSGHWATGDIKVIHPYNGEVAPGQGWMLCDGRTIGQAAYDTEHGAGSWATYVVSSLLNGKKLPGMTNLYAIGKATTPQDGSAPITTVGNPAHTISVEHSHRAATDHGAASNDTVSSSGSDDATAINTSGTAKNGSHYTLKTAANSQRMGITGGGMGMGSGVARAPGDAANWSEDIRPDSIEACFYMRIV
jgi:hypothetical protein